MNNDVNNTATDMRDADERRDFKSYVWGAGLALTLTVVPFALVAWSDVGRTALLSIIGGLAFAQMAVHFRFFLHLGLKRKREDLLLILFSASLLIIMATGTIWIMANLAYRMMPAM